MRFESLPGFYLVFCISFSNHLMQCFGKKKATLIYALCTEWEHHLEFGPQEGENEKTNICQIFKE